MRTMRLRQTEEKDYCKRFVVPLLVTISIELPSSTRKTSFSFLVPCIELSSTRPSIIRMQ